MWYCEDMGTVNSWWDSIKLFIFCHFLKYVFKVPSKVPSCNSKEGSPMHKNSVFKILWFFWHNSEHVHSKMKFKILIFLKLLINKRDQRRELFLLFVF